MRSGFAYICQVFQQLGLDVRHESFRGKDGIAAWYLMDLVDGTKFAAYISGKNPLYLHQVRHPLNTLSSMVPRIHKRRDKLEEWDENDIVNAARLWLVYSRRADRLQHHRYRLEELDLAWLCRLVGVEERPVDVPKTFNSYFRRGSTKRYDEVLTWERLSSELPYDLYTDIKDLAGIYGYL